MERCDALIVGGGPAGSACAALLYRAGLDVLVIDKAKFPRDKTCAGWITPDVVKSVQLDLEEYQQGRVLQTVNGFYVSRIGGPLVLTDYGHPVSYGIRRCEFDHYLLNRSQARVIQGESVRTIERAGDRWLVNGSIETPMIVGAGGHFCPIARFLNAKDESPQQIVAAQEIEFLLDESARRECRVRGEFPELYFCPDLQGYGWAVLKGNYLNIGLGREDQEALPEHTQRFVRFLQDKGRIPRSIPSKFHGHAYILYANARKKWMADGVLLAGDSAGLAYTRSGEGILSAVESGRLAAETVIVAAGDYRARKLESYVVAMTKRFGEVDPANGLMSRVPMAIKRALAIPLFASHWFTRRIVLDQWFLHPSEGTRHAAVHTRSIPA